MIRLQVKKGEKSMKVEPKQACTSLSIYEEGNNELIISEPSLFSKFCHLIIYSLGLYLAYRIVSSSHEGSD